MLIWVVPRGGIQMGDAPPSRGRVCRKYLGWDPSTPENRNKRPSPRAHTPLCTSSEVNPPCSPFFPPPQSRRNGITCPVPFRATSRTRPEYPDSLKVGLARRRNRGLGSSKWEMSAEEATDEPIGPAFTEGRLGLGWGMSLSCQGRLAAFCATMPNGYHGGLTGRPVLCPKPKRDGTGATAGRRLDATAASYARRNQAGRACRTQRRENAISRNPACDFICVADIPLPGRRPA